MKASTIRAIVSALNRKRVRYLVVGGLAVNAHGVLRFTADLDLVVQLEAANVRRGFEALRSLGYRPMVPVTAEGFGDAATRRRWIRDKGMRVLRFCSDAHRETLVDLFVEEPFPFAKEYRACLRKRLAGMAPARFVSLRTLIRMKEQAGRPKDLVDLHDLRGKLRR